MVCCVPVPSRGGAWNLPFLLGSGAPLASGGCLVCLLALCFPYAINVQTCLIVPAVSAPEAAVVEDVCLEPFSQSASEAAVSQVQRSFGVALVSLLVHGLIRRGPPLRGWSSEGQVHGLGPAGRW